MLLLYASYVHILSLRKYRYHGHERPQNCLFIATNVACVVGPSVNSFSTDFIFSKTWFFYNLFEFLMTKNDLKFNISPILSPNFTIYISLNPTP